jgi:uncharacterized Zn finger protein
MSVLLREGGPLVVEDERERRIGRGPWSRLLATAVVPDEGSRTAERGRALARAGEVRAVTVAEGVLEGRAGDCTVTIAADPVPPRVWDAVRRYARGNHRLEAAVAGREQSVQLEHVLSVDWDEPLVPRAHELTRACTCGESGCEHAAALGYALAAELDREPALLLRWRGCFAQERERAEEPAAATVADDAALWRAGPLPPPRPLRPLPVGAVLKRLGPSGIVVGREELADVLERAYRVFSRV